MELYADPTVERVVVQSFEKYKNNVLYIENRC